MQRTRCTIDADQVCAVFCVEGPTVIAGNCWAADRIALHGRISEGVIKKIAGKTQHREMQMTALFPGRHKSQCGRFTRTAD